MKTKHPIVSLVIVLLLFLNQTYAQSYIDDAKNLVAFNELYNSGTDIATFKAELTSDDFIDLVIAKLDEGNFGSSSFDNGTAQPGDVIFNPTDEGVSGGTDISPTANLSNALREKIRKEISWYMKFAAEDDAIYDNNKLKAIYADFPDSFKYLVPTIKALENTSSMATSTSGFGIGTLLGVSEAQILQGITDWALNRAQEELMQAFLREWLEKIQSDPILAQAFPNTLTMLATSDLTSIYTDGDTWKATFRQDFDAIPDKIPIIARLVLDQSKRPIPETTKAEMIAGLEVLSQVYGELNKNKRPDEILMLLGEKSFLNYVDEDYHPVVHRSIVGTQIFIKSILSNNDGTPYYVKPNTLLKLTETELKAVWKLINLREKEKIKFTFGLKDATAERAFYDNGLKHIQEFKLLLSNVSETIAALSEMLKKLTETQATKMGMDEYHTYSLLVFDLLASGANIMEKLADVPTNAEAIKKYKELYKNGYEYLAKLHTGIKTREYGLVALNTVNLVVWMQEFVVMIDPALLRNIDALIDNARLQVLVTDDVSKQAIAILIDKIEDKLEENLKPYPQTLTFAYQKLNNLEGNLTANGVVLTKELVIKEIKSTFEFSELQTRIVIKEVATNGLQNIQSSSEALNTYTKLMASILLAEDSDDIKDALNSVAMKKGGYLVRQKSAFSATVTFYPGIAYGWETLKSNDGLPNTTGTYIGATLPIGVELAAGTNAKPMGAVGLFIQLLDLGAVLNYSLKNDNEDVAANPEFGFEQVFSPGAYATFHITNNPITFGVGASYSPKLREVNSGGTTLQANALQYGFFLGVDLNVFTIFGSKKKFPLNSRSLKVAYDKQ